MDRLPISSSTCVSRQARALSARDRILDAAGLRALAVLEEIVAAAADAVHLLGEIDHLEPAGKGAHQVARQRRRPAAHPGGERGARRASPPRPRMAATRSLLDQLEQLLAALLAQDLAHQRAERVHVIAQRLVLGREMDVAAVHSVVASCWRGPRNRCAASAPRRSAVRWGLHHAPAAHRADAPRAETSPGVAPRLRCRRSRCPGVPGSGASTCCTSTCSSSGGGGESAVQRLLGRPRAARPSVPSAAPQKRAAASRSSVWQSMMNPARRLLCMG